MRFVDLHAHAYDWYPRPWTAHRVLVHALLERELRVESMIGHVYWNLVNVVSMKDIHFSMLLIGVHTLSLSLPLWSFQWRIGDSYLLW